MKIYQSNADYPGYSFPTVALAYFLRYPNPYAKHVISTDTISQHIDPVTQRLHTVRLHLKRSKVPTAVVKFLPKAMTGADGSSKTYILEKSIVDVKEGWMETESRNMEWTGVLSVIEQQKYQDRLLTNSDGIPGTHCKTTVTFISKLGETIRKRRKANQTKPDMEVDEEQPTQGWFASWSKAGIQRTIELVGVKRTQTAVINSCEGMKVVLERLRNGGVKGVLEAMRHDRMEMMAGLGQPEDGSPSTTWKAVWQQGVSQQDGRTDKNDDRNN